MADDFTENYGASFQPDLLLGIGAKEARVNSGFKDAKRKKLAERRVLFICLANC
ncbi:hypothetical protein [Photobacterium sp. J15]|uniref:hypothetical protein n=1 Tax=Photobacterium sp. J15 TaxID=265901 RepID=UPI000AF28E33|nr:hypothetical protein [Photobacterium sp. J15]